MSVIESGQTIVQRADEGARLLTVRGFGMRAVSIASNLALIALVPPEGLGLLAVVRGITGIAGNTSDLGFAWALLRRPEQPTRSEYGALAGMQVLLITLVIGTVFLVPSLLSRIGAVPEGWLPAMLLVMLTMFSVPMGTGSKIRLEREMDFRRLAFVDVSSVLLQNVLLLVFAALGVFAMGVFVSTGITILYFNLTLWYFAPASRPMFNVAAWRGLSRQFAGFSIGHCGSMLGSFGTPILLAHLFGLPVAGLWAFAARLGNVLQLAYDGVRRAAIPAAARLVESSGHLRSLVQNSLTRAVAVTVPMMAGLVVTLPLVGLLLPRWAPAVVVAQCFVLGSGLLGMVAASVVPAAVAQRGARMVLVEQFVPIAVGWSGFAVIAALGGSGIAWAILPMHLLTLLAIWRAADSRTRPHWDSSFRKPLIGLGVACLVAVIAGLYQLHAVTTAVVGVGGYLASARPSIRSMPRHLVMDRGVL